MLWFALAGVVLFIFLVGFGFGFYWGIISTGRAIGQRATECGLYAEVVDLLSRMNA